MPPTLPTPQMMLPVMLVLIVPSFVVCAVISVAAWRRRGADSKD